MSVFPFQFNSIKHTHTHTASSLVTCRSSPSFQGLLLHLVRSTLMLVQTSYLGMTFLKSLLNLSSVKEISLHYEYLYMNVSQGIVQLPNPLFFLCSHPSSFILCRYSFIFCQRLKQIPKGLFLSSFMGFSLSFNSLLLILQLPRLFSFYLCFIRLLTCLFPA